LPSRKNNTAIFGDDAVNESQMKKNIPASVRQRLLNRSRKERRPFGELLQYYAMERFLYPLSVSPYKDSFILKGALMLQVWGSTSVRSTMDIDLLGRNSNEEAIIVNQVWDILQVSIDDDGLRFDLESITSERITEDADYEGIRIRFRGSLETAIIHMQIDIGFGDIVYPEYEEHNLPVILDMPIPRLLCYSRESAIAEKFETMIKRGEINSRMKDFYDIWLLSRQYDFDGTRLSEAIRLTCKQRGTSLPGPLRLIKDDFIDVKQVQWTAFRKRLQQEHVPVSFRDIISTIENFLVPCTSSIVSGSSIPNKWNAPGPWV
jgi:predicted nucleotidyltransferase component of viral defense system